MADLSELHTAQVEYWNGAGGARWVAGQDRRDKMLSNFTGAAIDVADPKPGEVVIDIGCGCGDTSLLLAEAVGPQGHLLAADVSAPILAVARERLAPYANAEAVLADASSYPFAPGGADLLFSRFGVMFFGDPTAAFTNLRKALKPGGRVVFACWRAAQENALMTIPLEAVFSIIDRPPPPDPDAPGPFSFANQDKVRRILLDAGFTEPTFHKHDPLVDIGGGAGIEGAVEIAIEFGPTARALLDQPPEIKQEVADALRKLFGAMAPDGVVKLGAAIWVVHATSPA